MADSSAKASDEQPGTTMSPEPLLKLLLRLFGTNSLCALLFVAAPHAWMDALHASLGLGPLPAEPIVGYLARSTSAFYALLGGLFWLVSFDLARHRAVVIYLGGAIAALGVALFFIDRAEGLPPAWVFWEGPVVTLLGIALWSLGKRLPDGPSARA